MRTILLSLILFCGWHSHAASLELSLSITSDQVSFPDGVIPTILKSSQDKAHTLDIKVFAEFEPLNETTGRFLFTHPIKVRTEQAGRTSEIHYSSLTVLLESGTGQLNQLTQSSSSEIYIDETDLKVDELLEQSRASKSLMPFVETNSSTLPKAYVFNHSVHLRIQLEQLHSIPFSAPQSIRVDFKEVMEYDSQRNRLVIDQGVLNFPLTHASEVLQPAPLFAERSLELLETLLKIRSLKQSLTPEVFRFSSQNGQEYVGLKRPPAPQHNVVALPFKSCKKIFAQ